jgi:hypothetical protein
MRALAAQSFNLLSIGPKYDKSGKIVNYSILGPTDKFLKTEKKMA